ncbi:hypothetical protein [Azonexus hydrophilus]|uniref:Uncharacterized protein n=1 Tax=Azonexus hydrophilus TaxID=418702 RepID=A0ABZ2XN06_9RHOO
MHETTVELIKAHAATRPGQAIRVGFEVKWTFVSHLTLTREDLLSLTPERFTELFQEEVATTIQDMRGWSESAELSKIIEFSDECGNPIESAPFVMHQCDNCSSSYTEDELNEAKDLEMRVDAGGEMPSGECPQCGALCYPTEVSNAMISATAHDDDYCYEVEFNAAPWFAQASEAEIIELHETGWMNDQPADEVARFCSSTHDGLKQMFAYAELAHTGDHPCGFECSVDKDEALAWLKACRTVIWAKILCADEGIVVDSNEAALAAARKIDQQ